MSDAKSGLGARMKDQYEDRTRYMLPRRTWTIVRVDGKAFHTFTRGCVKPFDEGLHAGLVNAAIGLCTDSQGAVLGFVQSDEISVVFTDFNDIHTEAWFDGNVQKIASVSASIVTGYFLGHIWHRMKGGRKPPAFDARAFTIPDQVEVENYLIWRQQDAIRNSVSGLAQSLYSPKELHGKGQAEMLAMCAAKGKPWEDSPVHVQRGTVVRREAEERRGWLPDREAPLFTADRDYIKRSMLMSGEVAP